MYVCTYFCMYLCMYVYMHGHSGMYLCIPFMPPQGWFVLQAPEPVLLKPRLQLLDSERFERRLELGLGAERPAKDLLCSRDRLNCISKPVIVRNLELELMHAGKQKDNSMQRQAHQIRAAPWLLTCLVTCAVVLEAALRFSSYPPRRSSMTKCSLTSSQ